MNDLTWKKRMCSYDCPAARGQVMEVYGEDKS